MALSGQRIARLQKDFRASFRVPLEGYFVACQIANSTVTGELSAEKEMLVMGKYDLLFCYRKGLVESSAVTETKVLTRTFCEEMPLAQAFPGEVELKLHFSRPLRVQAREGRPDNSGLLKSMKNLVSCVTWVEVQVEGEITAEVVQAREAGAEPVEGREKTVPGKGESSCLVSGSKSSQSEGVTGVAESGAARALREAGVAGAETSPTTPNYPLEEPDFARPPLAHGDRDG